MNTSAPIPSHPTSETPRPSPPLPEQTFALQTVAEGVRVLDPALGPDTVAVLGAMMSRTPHLATKINTVLEEILRQEGRRSHPETERVIQHIITEGTTAEHPDFGEQVQTHFQNAMQGTQGLWWDYRSPPERIQSFLRQNLHGYGHPSIADMAYVAIVLGGFGWPSAWLLEDFSLFAGQELSTRAVDALQIPGQNGPGTPCRYAPEGMEDLHRQWLRLYAEIRSGSGSNGSYRYDDARVYLPGTIPTEVVLTQSVRNIARHLDHIHDLGEPFSGLSAQGYQGLTAAAPVTTWAIGHKNRRALQQWQIGQRSLHVASTAGPADFVSVEIADGGRPEDYQRAAEKISPRARHNQHLDPLWNHAPRLRIRLVCTVAAARDFHRHRVVMPWLLSVVRSPDGNLVMAPWYGMQDRVPNTLLEETGQAFDQIAFANEQRSSAQTLQALHALPFGALVTLEAVATLPAVLYLLEMRASVSGALSEYKTQSYRGLERLCEVLPAELVAQEHLDGCLRNR